MIAALLVLILCHTVILAVALVTHNHYRWPLWALMMNAFSLGLNLSNIAHLLK